MTLRVRVDQDVCVGSGTCLHVAPGAFEIDDDGIAYVVEGHDASDDDLREAERSCPTGAIIIEDDEDATP